MAKKGGGGHDDHDEGGGHGDRPWVFFMIDCFMLVLQFFILTFKFKDVEPVLPGQLPPGSEMPSKTPPPEKKPIVIYAMMNQVYQVDGQNTDLSGLETTVGARLGASSETSVKIRYDKAVPWGDVFAIYNLAAKYKVKEVGLIPLRIQDMPPG